MGKNNSKGEEGGGGERERERERERMSMKMENNTRNIALEVVWRIVLKNLLNL